MPDPDLPLDRERLYRDVRYASPFRYMFQPSPIDCEVETLGEELCELAGWGGSADAGSGESPPRGGHWPLLLLHAERH